MPSLPKSPPRPWIPKSLPRAYVKPAHGKDGFYQSQDWKDARAAALARCGKVCALCGRTGWTVDHKQPVRLGGDKLSQANLQVLCVACHAKKSAQERQIKTP